MPCSTANNSVVSHTSLHLLDTPRKMPSRLARCTRGPGKTAILLYRASCLAKPGCFFKIHSPCADVASWMWWQSLLQCAVYCSVPCSLLGGADEGPGDRVGVMDCRCGPTQRDVVNYCKPLPAPSFLTTAPRTDVFTRCKWCSTES